MGSLPDFLQVDHESFVNARSGDEFALLHVFLLSFEAHSRLGLIVPVEGSGDYLVQGALLVCHLHGGRRCSSGNSRIVQRDSHPLEGAHVGFGGVSLKNGV